MDVEELAKSDCLGVTQLREVARNVLDGAMALAELDGKRTSTNIARTISSLMPVGTSLE